MIKRSNLALQVLNNIIIFNKNDETVFVGEDIRKNLSNCGISVSTLFSEKILKGKSDQFIASLLSQVRNNQNQLSFKFEKLNKVLILFPIDINGDNSIILLQKDEIHQINRIEHQLKERVKELECLYNISKALEASKGIKKALEKSALYIEEGFQFPKLTFVQFEIRGETFGIKDLPTEDVQNSLFEDIILNGEKIGEIKVFCTTKSPFLDEERVLIKEISGKVSGAIEKSEKTSDLEERKKTLVSQNKMLTKLTEELKESREKIQTFFTAITDRIVVIDSDFNIKMSNKEEIGESGKCYKKLFDSDQVCDNCPAILTFRNAEDGIIEQRTDEQYFRLRSYPIYNKSGKVDGVLEVCSDITKEKGMESQLIQAYKLASLGKLVAGVAHEINNPNTFILGNLKIVSEAFEDIMPILDDYYEKNKDLKIARLNYDIFKDNILTLINDMVIGANRTNRIVKDLRNFAKKDDGLLTEIVDINHIIEDHMTIVEKQVKKYAKIEHHLNPDVPKFKGNNQRIEQVLVNMITNASQAIENGGGLIKVETDYNSNTKEIIIKINDNGKGMDEKTRRNIFDPFFTTKRNDGGTGLGLSISYGIIKEHQGRIEVKSSLGEGTIFTIFIPVTSIEVQ